MERLGWIIVDLLLFLIVLLVCSGVVMWISEGQIDDLRFDQAFAFSLAVIIVMTLYGFYRDFADAFWKAYNAAKKKQTKP